MFDGEYPVKEWYKSRTVWAGILEILIGVLGLVATFVGYGVYTPEAIILLVIGALTIVLRKITIMPIV